MSSTLKRSPGRTLGRLGLVLLALSASAAMFAPLVARHSPTRPSGLPLRRPGLGHPLGTDDLGVDIFAQLVYGARISLAIGVGAAALALAIGLLVAVVAGWKRGWAEAVLMRLTDVTLAFPFLPLVLVLAAFLGRGLVTTAVVIAAVSWARPARVLWAQVLKLREFQHVQAARAMGGSGTRIVSRHILTRLTPLASAQFVRVANAAVISEAALAFLGLGDPNQASWGIMLSNASSNNALLTGAWKWWMLPPGFALTVVVLGFAFTGYACEEWADPRLASTSGRLRFLSGPRRRPPTVAPVAPAGDPILEVRDLVVSYRRGTPPAVKGVSFEVPRGRITALVGESGSGKSTIVMGLLGLLPGDPVVQGEATFEGRKLLSAAAAARVRGRRIGLVTQAAMNALNPAYTIHAQIAEAAELTMPPDRARRRATELLGDVGLPASAHQAYPHELSGGMRQRVIIAMALANSPDLLIADEPTTGLDLVTQASILRLVQDLKDRLGLTVLIITHDVQMVLRVADELVILEDGRVVERGDASKVASAPTEDYSRRLLNTRLSPLGARA
ncbi:MAG: Oligopeptide transport ATP-binding protein OppD [uncultured Acidimicrobiales bacterium]|uniref:Oligopeptide transport ATP-binding protein OppD n=1 Tax=uncultured Acidimicrobiales bacterium TaxID=310071 RepID=A0A6J4JCP2_9ACTN|nr:MAG: Oligopeptide transport ATP-binding protein OppD [uncultured Acidimicrobiales bacterium]